MPDQPSSIVVCCSRRAVHVLVVFMLALCLAVSASAESPGPQAHFTEHIEPILVGKCLTCHGADRKGGLDLRSKASALKGGDSGVVLAPGDAAGSLLMQYVRDGEMPPKEPLSPDEVAAIEAWIAGGARFPDQPLDPFAATTDKRAGYDWWSFQPITDAQPPAANEAAGAWADHPIDQFVLAQLREAGLDPSPPADARTIIRRATYDLIGLPPTPDEVAAFRAACAAETGSPDVVGDRAYAELVDRLLASPHYGEHWGRHWLDVVRFGESSGYEVNHLIDNVWPFRDYVIESFNDDKPYDQLVREHLAGDVLGYGDPDVEIATAFLVCGPYDTVGNQDPVQAAQIRANGVDEMIRTTSEAFLGLTVGCARCHDHKFDPIAQRDYYRMYATFAGVSHGERVIATEDERAQHAAKREPLVAERDAVQAELDALEQAIVDRAEAKAAEYEAQWTRPKVERSGTEEVFDPVEAKFLRLTSEGRDADPRAPWPFKMDEFEVWTAGPDARNVALASNGGTATGASRHADDFGAAYLVDVTIDGAFGVSWIAQGPSITIEFARPETVDRILFSSDRPKALGDNPQAVFVCEYRVEVSLDGETWTEVADSHDRNPVHDRHRRERFLRLEQTDDEAAQLADLRKQLDEANAAVNAVPALPRYWIGKLAQPEGPIHIFEGGDPQRKGAEVVPASMKALSSDIASYALEQGAPEKDRRLQLADWIVDKRNPITSRVLVNRLWHYHFGRGIVSTPSDFGFMGELPSHPALLDWLAREFTDPAYGGVGPDQAWRMKRMHRLIMMSQTYRQASSYREAAARVDGDSRMLWRFPPRRLNSDQIRDGILAIAGKLDTTMGGPGFRLYNYWRDNVATYVPLDEHGPETYRRAVYHQHARAERLDLITDFDFPDCSMSTPKRAITTSPLQALTLMNHDFTLDIAGFLGERLVSDAGEGNPIGQIERAFELAFTREPTELEIAASLVTIETHGLRAFCRALLNANELIYID